MDAELDKLCRSRERLEEQYYNIKLPPIMRPGAEVLYSDASDGELRFVCEFFVTVQRRLLRIISFALSRSFDKYVDELTSEAREALDRAERKGDSEMSLRTLLKSLSKLNPYQRTTRKQFLRASPFDRFLIAFT
jgi:hypothetical protein